MPDTFHKLQVSDADREAFVLCVVLGTLEAIRAGDWHPDAAIWTFGRPAFKSFLADASLPANVKAVFEVADELGAIREISGTEEYERCLANCIETVRARLRELPSQSWEARWIR